MRPWLLGAILVAALISASILAFMFLVSPRQGGQQPSFTIQASPREQVFQGSQVNIFVNVTSQNNFKSPVTLTLSTNLPAGMTHSWDSSTVTPPRNESRTSILTLTIGAHVAPQNYTLTILGSSGGLTRTSALILSVLELPPGPIFGLTISPASLIVDRGLSGFTDVTVVSRNGFSSTVSLSVANVPSGVTATLNTTTVIPPPDGNSTARLTVDVSNNALPGLYLPSISATDNVVTLTRILELTIPAPPPLQIYLIASTAGWNSTADTPCSPSGTSICNPDLTVLLGQKLQITIEWQDPTYNFNHNLAYYGAGYPWGSVFLGNPDALNGSDIVTSSQATTLFSHTFDTAGTYEYYCELHPEAQHGTVIVNKGLASLLTANAAPLYEVTEGGESMLATWYEERVASEVIRLRQLVP